MTFGTVPFRENCDLDTMMEWPGGAIALDSDEG
jgi:hypothetical protein